MRPSLWGLESQAHATPPEEPQHPGCSEALPQGPQTSSKLSSDLVQQGLCLSAVTCPGMALPLLATVLGSPWTGEGLSEVPTQAGRPILRTTVLGTGSQSLFRAL